LAARLQRSLRACGCAARAAPTGDEEGVEPVAGARGMCGTAGLLWRCGGFTGTDRRRRARGGGHGVKPAGGIRARDYNGVIAMASAASERGRESS
jgi:hypothetical protein